MQDEVSQDEESTEMGAVVGIRQPRQWLSDRTVAAVLVDATGRILEATASAAAILGRRAAELGGRQLDDIAARGWGWVVRNSLLRLASGSLDAFELLLRGRSGRRSLVRMIPQPMPDEPPGDSHYLLLWFEQRQETPSDPASASEAELRRQAYGLLRTHEAELGRVASELHDGVAPLVVMAKFMIEDALGRLARGAQGEAVELMTGTVARLREVLAEIRRISTELRPSSLDDLGLLPTIEWHCRIVGQAYQAMHVATELAVEEAFIPDPLKLDIFRIVQEGLNNVVRHARATEACVALHAVGGRLVLRVEDNGIGFNVEPVLRGDVGVVGLGLQSLRKRVYATRGRLQIESTPWQGTRISADWPLLEAQA